MKPLRVARHGLLVAVLMALLVGCATSTPGSTGSGAEPSGVTFGSLVTTTPPIEGSGPESPQPPQPGQPSVNLARLPIGGGFTEDVPEAARCVQVRWLGDIPKGVSRISVTGATFTQPGIFTTGGKGCGNKQPRCKEFSAQHTDCLWPVVQVKDSNDDVFLNLSGTATCVDKGSCAGFEKNVNAQQKPITLQAQPGVVGQSRSTSAVSTRVSNSGSPTRGG